MNRFEMINFNLFWDGSSLGVRVARENGRSCLRLSIQITYLYVSPKNSKTLMKSDFFNLEIRILLLMNRLTELVEISNHL